MNYEEGIQAILDIVTTAQLTDPNGDYRISKQLLRKKFYEKYPSVGKDVLDDFLIELDKRGWLLDKEGHFINFDPATFQ